MIDRPSESPNSSQWTWKEDIQMCPPEETETLGPILQSVSERVQRKLTQHFAFTGSVSFDVSTGMVHIEMPLGQQSDEEEHKMINALYNRFAESIITSTNGKVQPIQKPFPELPTDAAQAIKDQVATTGQKLEWLAAWVPSFKKRAEVTKKPDAEKLGNKAEQIPVIAFVESQLKVWREQLEAAVPALKRDKKERETENDLFDFESVTCLLGYKLTFYYNGREVMVSSLEHARLSTVRKGIYTMSVVLDRAVLTNGSEFGLPDIHIQVDQEGSIVITKKEKATASIKGTRKGMREGVNLRKKEQL